MSRRDDSVPVRHMLDAARDILELVAGRSRAEFEADSMLHAAVQHLFTRIGRHAGRVTDATRMQFPDISWLHLIAYGDSLVRDYDKVDHDTLWWEATENVPVLLAALERLLPGLLAVQTHNSSTHSRKQNRTAAVSRRYIHVLPEQVAEFCRRNHICKLSFFGSVLRDDFRPESDIDVLVEFEPGYNPGLAFFGLEDELSAILGRKVDLLTPESLSPYFRDEVLAEAEVQYAQL